MSSVVRGFTSKLIKGLSRSRLRRRTAAAVTVLALALFGVGTGSAWATFQVESDEATFFNPGIFVSLHQEFGELSITEDMIQKGETDPLTAVLHVHSTVPYSLRVEIANESDVDLAGSAINENHPRVQDPRDVFYFRVSDSRQSWPNSWHPGSIPVILPLEDPTIGNSVHEHVIELKVVFSDSYGQLFRQARPGHYLAKVTFEVEEER